VNTARGAVVNETALVNALSQSHLAGAALDVLEDEQQQEKRLKSPLLAYARMKDNLLITPHLGGATDESMGRAELFMAQKLQKWCSSALKAVSR
jgi:D-3-phosphoglycerate dehydrogenase